MKEMLRVLHVEDEAADAALIRRQLERDGFEPQHKRVETAEELRAALASQDWDLVICDYCLPSFSAPEALTQIRAYDPDLPVLVISGTIGEEVAAETMRLGAHDYLMKDRLTRLGEAVRRELREAKLRRDRTHSRQTVEHAYRLLAIAARHSDKQALLQEFNHAVREISGCQASAVRVRDGQGKLGFAAEEGFDPEYIKALDDTEADRMPELCYCKRVLQGEADPDKPFYTDNMSFYCNALGSLCMQENGKPAAESAYLCRRLGYRSVAALPIRVGDRILGLLQVADPRENKVPRSLVQVLEAAALQLGQAMDRLDRAQAQAESEALYRTLVDTMPDAMVRITDEGTISHANRQAAEMTGLPDPGAMVGTSPLDYFSPKSRAKATKALGDALAGQEAPGGFYEILRPDGTVLPVEIQSAGFQLDGAGSRWVVSVLRDVSERLRFQSQLSQADRMATVGMLAAGVAHEINNPLTYIQYNLESLANELPGVFEAGGAPEAQGGELMDLLAAARGGTRRVRDIVGDLKSFARVSDERKDQVQVNKVIDSALRMAHNQIKYRATIQRDLAEIPPVRISEGRLCQVLLNLLVNAGQAIEEESPEENRIQVITRNKNGQVLLEIMDTGQGIAAEDMDKLFDPFFTTKPKGVGSGLGLSICKEIVEEAGGQIQVQSQAGQGSCFRLVLPAAEPERAETPTPAPPATRAPKPAGAKGRILLVDDEPRICAVLRRILRGHELEEVHSGADCIDLLKKDSSFDVILTDLMMPEITGMDIWHWIEGNQPALLKKVVFMSGGIFNESVQDFLAKTGAPKLDKPFDPQAIRGIMAQRIRSD